MPWVLSALNERLLPSAAKYLNSGFPVLVLTLGNGEAHHGRLAVRRDGAPVA